MVRFAFFGRHALGKKMNVVSYMVFYDRKKEITEFTSKSLFNTYWQFSFQLSIQWENSAHKQTFHTPGTGR